MDDSGQLTCTTQAIDHHSQIMQLITMIIPNHSVNTLHCNNMQHITLVHQMLYNGTGGPWGLTTTSPTPMAYTVQSIQYNLYRPSNGSSKYITSKRVGSSRRENWKPTHHSIYHMCRTYHIILQNICTFLPSLTM